MSQIKEEEITMDGFAQITEHDHLWTECFNWKRESLVISRLHLETRIYKNFNLLAENFKLNKEKGHKRLEIVSGSFKNFKDLENVIITGFEIDSLAYKTFKNLPSLRVLNLAGNSIRKIETSAFVDLPNLESLDLNHNRLQHVPGLQKMHKLKYLDMNSNMFMKINRKMFRENVSLEHLKLSCNFVEKVDSVTFSDLKELRQLNLCHNRISKVHRNAFNQLAKLNRLSLQHNLIETLDDSIFIKQANLVKLDLSENHLTLISGTIFKSTVNLEYLNLANNRIQQVDLMAFSQLSKLKKLNLSGNRIALIAPLHFANLTLLEELQMGDNCFESLESNTFCGLKNLIKLDLSRNELRKIHDDLFKSQTKLEYLDLCGNFIESLSDSVFATLKCLINLNLRKNKLKVIEKNCFKELERLEILDICSNLIESLDIKIFSSFKNCKTLRMYCNKLKSVSKEIFQGMTALEELDLSGNMLETVDSSYFTHLKGLKLLFLRQNQIKSLGDMLFQQLKEVVEIDLSYNYIQSLPEFIFANLPCLERIKLDNNLLKNMTENRFVNLPALKLLTLHFNFIETLHEYTFKRLNSEHPISIYLSLNTFVTFNITWFEDLNPASHICHSGDISIYDSNMMYRELFNVVSVIESRDDKLKREWIEKRQKADTDKIIELNPVSNCNHLIYILLQSNDIRNTLIKQRTMRVFDMLIQDRNVSSQFIMSILLLLKENRGLYNAELYDPDFAISDDSFKKLCKNGEHELLTIFLVVTTWTDNVDFKQYLIYLNIALLNNHEKVALCVFNHLKSRNFEFYELLRKFFLQRFFEVYAKYAREYYNPSSSSSFTELFSNFTSALSSNTVLSTAFSADGITNLGVIFKNKWHTFIIETLNICKRGKSFYFKCIEYNENSSVDDLLSEFFGPPIQFTNKIKDSGLAGNGKQLLKKAWSAASDDIDEDDEEMLSRASQRVRNECKRHHLLGYIARSDNLSLLTHPTTLMLLDLKWKVFPRTYYYLNLLFYVIFLVLFSIYSDEFGSDYKRSVLYWLPVLIIINYFLLIAILTALYIVLQRGFMSLLQEIKVMINITALAISQVAIFMPYETPDQLNVRSGLYAMGLFIAYIDFSTRLDKVPFVGPYVEVVINVAMKFARFIPLYITICMGTLLAFRVRSRFNIVDMNDPNEITYFNTTFAFGIAQLISLNIGGPVADVMGLGDGLTSANMVNYFLYLLFSFIICIFLFNIFIGIGVDQIGEIINNSEVQNLKIKVDYVLEIEDFLTTMMKRIGAILNRPILRQLFFVYRILQWIMSLIVCDEYEPNKSRRSVERRQRGTFMSMLINYYEQMNMFSSMYEEENGPDDDYKEHRSPNYETLDEIAKLSDQLIEMNKNLLLVRNASQFNRNFDEVVNYLKYNKDREGSSSQKNNK